jgi:hypothetical protein
MTQRSAAATEVARRLWQRAVGDSTTPEDVAVAATQMCTELRVDLTRWVGAMGYRALVDRALVLARAEHPALGSLSCHGGDEPVITAAVRAHSADEVAAGMVALVAALVELLGRILGEEMAARLVDQTGIEVDQTGIEREERERERETEPARSREH